MQNWSSVRYLVFSLETSSPNFPLMPSPDFLLLGNIFFTKVWFDMLYLNKKTMLMFLLSPIYIHKLQSQKKKQFIKLFVTIRNLYSETCIYIRAQCVYLHLLLDGREKQSLMELLRDFNVPRFSFFVKHHFNSLIV